MVAAAFANERHAEAVGHGRSGDTLLEIDEEEERSSANCCAPELGSRECQRVFHAQGIGARPT